MNLQHQQSLQSCQKDLVEARQLLELSRRSCIALGIRLNVVSCSVMYWLGHWTCNQQVVTCLRDVPAG